MELHYDGTLAGLFGLLETICHTSLPCFNAGVLLRKTPTDLRSKSAASPPPGSPALPASVRRTSAAAQKTSAQGDLFGEAAADPLPDSVSTTYPPHDSISAIYPHNDSISTTSDGSAAALLFELSVNAYDDFVLAWMSELPIEAAIVRFGYKVLAAAVSASGTRVETETARLAAEQAAADRGDEDVRTVSEAAYKAGHEIDRMRGLLRFNPDSRGIYTALCAPDHFVLPALAGHFDPRFGETPWAIIDEKRALVLTQMKGGEPLMISRDEFTVLTEPLSGRDSSGEEGGGNSWEKLWRTYHHSVNNADRKNPGLQRQFMPVRYWKYLTERRGD
jgi:probable DNA metabolism protein